MKVPKLTSPSLGAMVIVPRIPRVGVFYKALENFTQTNEWNDLLLISLAPLRKNRKGYKKSSLFIVCMPPATYGYSIKEGKLYHVEVLPIYSYKQSRVVDQLRILREI